MMKERLVSSVWEKSVRKMMSAATWVIIASMLIALRRSIPSIRARNAATASTISGIVLFIAVWAKAGLIIAR